MTNTYDPCYVSPPGETLQELFDERHVDIKKFCKKHKLEVIYVDWVLKGESSMRGHLIRAICEEFGTPKEFWESRDRKYWEWKRKSREQPV